MSAASIISLLQASASHSDAIRKPAEQQIIAYFDQPGFGIFLCSIIATRDGTVPDAVRLLAATRFMSLCTTRWAEPRPTKNQTASPIRVIPDNEKVELRNAVVTLLGDPSAPVANIMTTTISRIIKHDYPEVWPNIFEQLCQAVSTTEQTNLKNRLLQTLRACVRVIARLIHEAEYDSFDSEMAITKLYDMKRNALRQQAAAIFSVVAPIWSNSSARFLQAVASNDSSMQALDCAHQCTHSLKVLYTLMVEFMPAFAEQNFQVLQGFFAEVHSSLGTYLQARMASANPNYPLMPQVEKIFLRLAKLVIESQDEHRYAFVPILKPFLDFFLPLVTQPPPGVIQDFIEKVLIRGIRFYANILLCPEYTGELEDLMRRADHVGTAADRPTEQTINTAKQIIALHFKPEVVAKLSQVTIMRYLMLRESDLEKWDQEPEELLQEELSDAFMYTITACGEFLFHRLISFSEKVVAQEVWNIVQTAIAQCNAPADQVPLTAILLKDAAYYAIALGYNQLSDSLDFVSMFNGQLLADTQNPDPRYRLIRRRIASIIQYWSISIPPELTSVVYDLCMRFLSEEDIIVRIYGAIAIRNMVDNMDFESNSFAPYLQPTVEHIVRLVHDMKESDLSSKVLDILSMVIEQLGRQISPYAQLLIDFLFRLWQELGNERALTKQMIVRVLAKLVEAVPASIASPLQTLLVPLIDHCVKSKSVADQMGEGDTGEYLLEDGMRLWTDVLQQCDNMTMDLAKLFERLPPIVESFQGNVQQMGALLVLQGYIMTGGPEFLQSYISLVVQLLDLIMRTSRPMTCRHTIELAGDFIQLYPAHAPMHLQSCLKRVVEITLSTKEPNMVLQNAAATLLLRLPFTNKEFFLQFLQNNVIATHKPSIQLLLDLWLDRARTLDYIQEEKVWICGLSALLCTQDPAILPYIPGIVDVCVSLMRDLRQKESDSASRRDYTSQRDLKLVSGSHLEKLFKQLAQKDSGMMPHSDVQQFLIQRLRECIQLNGGAQFESQLLAAVSADSRSWLSSPPPPLTTTVQRVTLIDD